MIQPSGNQQALPVYELNGGDGLEFGYCRTHEKFLLQQTIAGRGIVRVHLDNDEALALGAAIIGGVNKRFAEIKEEIAQEEADDAALQAEIARADADGVVDIDVEGFRDVFAAPRATDEELRRLFELHGGEYVVDGITYRLIDQNEEN